MSYDLQIWSVRPFEPAQLKSPDQWQRSADGDCALRRGDWQIVINSSDEVLPEDVPDEVSALLPGIAWLTELNLEGDAPATASKLLRSTAKEIAKAAHGVVVDPQDDTVATPAGVKRFVPPKHEKKFSVLCLSWWFLTDALATRDGRNALLSLLEKSLPEAMPKRYGDYEPPQHKYEQTGKAHLEQFMADNMNTVTVWYPHRPVTGVDLSCPTPLGAGPQGFRSNLLEISIEKSVLAQPGWRETIDRIWHQMTHLLRPIYAEVRSYHNRIRMGGTVGIEMCDLKNDFRDITRSWFWRGIPRKLGHAIILGAEYQREWPELLAHTKMDAGFAFASTADWASDTDLIDEIGEPPERITLLPGEGMGQSQKYPPVWPFGPAFAERRIQ